MQLTGIFSLLAVALPVVIASPAIQAVYPRADNDNNGPSKDVRLLNLALIFEHITQGFYNYTLSKWDQAQFAADGYAPWVRNRFEEIQGHNEAHIAWLNAAIGGEGATPIQSCTYKFPNIVNNTRDFVDVSIALATISSSAYAGALKEFDNKDYSEVFAAFVGTEARHAAWINSAVKKHNPFNTAFETPLSLNMAFNIIGNFIIRGTCPKTNNIADTLPAGLTDDPSLTIPVHFTPGSPMSLQFNSSTLSHGNSMYAGFIAGSGTTFAPVIVDEETGAQSVVVPQEVGTQGAVYVVVVQAAEGVEASAAEDDNVMTSPALAMFAYDSYGRAVGEGTSEDFWEY